MPTWSRKTFGAAPVPPRKPSTTTASALDRAMPAAMAATLWTAALVAMGCRVCGNCYRGLCPWGIATQQENLVKRLNPDVASKQVANLIHAWTLELSELMGAAGINSIESLRGNRDRLRGYMLDENLLNVLEVKSIGA